jgi:hypothetical protein
MEELEMAVYITQAGALAFQGAGIPGWLLPTLDICSALPSPPDRGAVIGDFTLAAFTGYATTACVFVGGYVNVGLAKAYMLSPLISVPGPTSGAGVNATGWVLSDSSTHKVWAWGSFDDPIPLMVPTDLLAFTVLIYEDETSQVTIDAP